jgi:ABC-2 type transport system ATP-binding protein
MIEAHGLTKSYRRRGRRNGGRGDDGDGRHHVLRGIDLHVAPGTVHALLGPNGAGKTTTVRILATLTPPDGGTARVAGHDVRTQRRAVRRAISLIGQFAAIDETQTGEENLRMMARLAGRSRADARRRAADLLERFDLTAAGHDQARTYSGGMRRRLDLAAGLAGSPSVFFLDEPTTGLDPRSRRQLWQTVGALAAEDGATVLLTTQYLEEADRLADRVSVLHEGVLAAEGTADELKSRLGGHRLDLTLATHEAYLRLAPRAVRHSPEALGLSVPTDGTAPHVRSLLDALDPTGRDITHFALHTATLDDVFLALTEDGSPGKRTTEHPAHV